MDGNDVVAVLDWGFLGAYPLSELVARVRVDILEVIDGESEKENSIRILRMVVSTVKKRHWPENEVRMLVSSGDPIIGTQGQKCSQLNNILYLSSPLSHLIATEPLSLYCDTCKI